MKRVKISKVDQSSVLFVTVSFDPHTPPSWVIVCRKNRQYYKCCSIYDFNVEILVPINTFVYV